MQFIMLLNQKKKRPQDISTAFALEALCYYSVLITAVGFSYKDMGTQREVLSMSL